MRVTSKSELKRLVIQAPFMVAEHAHRLERNLFDLATAVSNMTVRVNHVVVHHSHGTQEGLEKAIAKLDAHSAAVSKLLKEIDQKVGR